MLSVIHDTRKEILQAFVEDVSREGVTVYTDEHRGFPCLDRKGNRKHKTVRQSKGEYISRDAGTNLMESLWVKIKMMGWRDCLLPI